MLLAAFPATVFATNCYVLATGPGEPAIVVDPGIGVIPALMDVLREHRLKPAAVLLTHGHLDHVYSVTPVCTTGDDTDLPAYIHGDDAYRLTDPISLLGPQLRGALEAQFGSADTWREPRDVRRVSDGDVVDVAGLDLTVRHTPGHTEGSVIFSVGQVPDAIPAPVTSTVLAGDVLFAGSIGRTDLLGGDAAAMEASLRDVILPLPDDTLILPGHGPATTMARERSTNPYLRGLSR